MCGIAGITRPGGATGQDLNAVERMNGIQEHRGPDDEGIFSDSHCVLGHRRLSIIDLSKEGRQPFFSDDRRHVMVYNGEIYNYIELRAELEAKGWRFGTKTDSEVLLKAYLHWGKSCLSKLNGMFAFAIYDTAERSLFLARDRIGIKPLYYSLSDSSLVFASEIKAVRAVLPSKPSLNHQALFDYLVFNRTDIYDETFFNEIRRLPKGHYATFRDGNFEIRKWWDPESFMRNRVEDDRETILETIRELLVSAVNLRMRSDVPVGSCLSGGLDSSILIGALYDEYGLDGEYSSFTASFPNHPIDETGYIDALNQKYPFGNFRTYPDAQKAAADLRDFVYFNDEPTTGPSFYSQYEVMRLAKEHGVTVLLDGQGGDENFAGYQYFHGFNMYGLLKQRRISAFCSEMARNLMRRQQVLAYQTLLFQIAPDRLRKELLCRTVPWIRREFFSNYVPSSKIFNEFFDADGLNMSLVRHFQYKLEHLLRTEDRNSMAFSLEARVPYLDYRLVEYVLGVAESEKIFGGETKYLQKKALGRYTIPEILNRTDKIGFGTPGADWMRTETWKRITSESMACLAEAFPGIFKKSVRLPYVGFDRWKVNQFRVWVELFLS